MTDKDVLDVHVLVRRKFNLLNEVLDISKQMATSLDRHDESSLRMLLAQRHDPIEQLEGLKTQIEDKINEFSPKETAHLWKILAGEAANTKAEEALKKQAVATATLLDEVLALDKRINQGINNQNKPT